MRDIADFDDDEFKRKLAKRIEKIRKSKGYSQDRVCLEAGFSRSTLSRIESGSSDLQVTTLAKIAFVLGVPITKFFELK